MIKGHGLVRCALSFLFVLALAPRAQAQHCDAASLGAALAAASAGDVVRVGACTVRGSFRVPDGVTLRGEGADRSTLEVSALATGVTLVAGPSGSALEGVRVASDGLVAIGATGSGAATVSDVRVDATRGVGIYADGVGALALIGVELAGSATSGTSGSYSYATTPADAATHGLAVHRAGDLSLDDVVLRGWARYGALVVGTDVTMSAVRALENVGVGVMVWGGRATVDDLLVRRTFRGALPAGEVAAGVAFGGGAAVVSDGLRSSQNAGFGVFHDATASVRHRRLFAGHNDLAGLWFQDAGPARLDEVTLVANDYAGVVALDTASLAVTDGSALGTRSASPAGLPTAGDGFTLVRTPADLRRVTLLANERVGLLAALAASQSAADLRLHAVQVAGGAHAYGVLLQQGGAFLPAVTAGVTRLGPVEANDLSIGSTSEVLTVTGIVQPGWELPAEQVAALGLGSLFGSQGPGQGK